MARWCSGPRASGPSGSPTPTCSPPTIWAPRPLKLTQSEALWAPLSYHERIRALGPTNLNHGKQAEGGAAVEALMHAQGAARSTGRIDLIKRK
jgi:hypothetical protein